MNVTISKTFDFDAAHRLERLPADHKCHRLHGHTYRVEIILRGDVDQPMGMFIDYADIAKAWQPIHDLVDHTCLNELAAIGHPTTENLAAWIFGKLKRTALERCLHAVRVYESATTWCEVNAWDGA